MAGSKKYRDSRNGTGKRILYDARGVRVKGSILNNRYIRILLFAVLPYLVINGIILYLVCATPSVSVEVSDTDDYVTSEVTFTVGSLIPIKSLEVTLESEDVEYEKSGKTYRATATTNGTFMVRATSYNGMQKTEFAEVAMLDDTAPSVDETTVAVNDSKLTFTISDSQSGVDYDSIFGVTDTGETIYPESCDRELGLVTMELPDGVSLIDLNFSDMVGNAISCSITVNVVVEYVGEETETESGEEETA